jgi:hypothetical protein
VVSAGISGRSGKISGDAGRERNDGLEFHLAGLEGGKSYRIAFDVRSLGSADAYPPYVLVRSRSGQCPDRGVGALDIGAGETVRRSVEFTLDDCENYYLLFGERYAGEYLVDNIEINAVTGIPVGGAFPDGSLDDWSTADD